MSKSFLISYDLDQPGQDYSRLINELDRLGAAKVLYSTWVLMTDYPASRVRDYLTQFIDGNDMLLVVGLTGEAAWTSLMVSSDRVKELIAA